MCIRAYVIPVLLLPLACATPARNDPRSELRRSLFRSCKGDPKIFPSLMTFYSEKVYSDLADPEHRRRLTISFWESTLTMVGAESYHAGKIVEYRSDGANSYSIWFVPHAKSRKERLQVSLLLGCRLIVKVNSQSLGTFGLWNTPIKTCPRALAKQGYLRNIDPPPERYFLVEADWAALRTQPAHGSGIIERFPRGSVLYALSQDRTTKETPTDSEFAFVHGVVGSPGYALKRHLRPLGPSTQLAVRTNNNAWQCALDGPGTRFSCRPTGEFGCPFHLSLARSTLLVRASYDCERRREIQYLSNPQQAAVTFRSLSGPASIEYSVVIDGNGHTLQIGMTIAPWECEGW